MEFWKTKRNEILEIASKETPIYLYDVETMKEQVALLNKYLGKDCINKVFYSMKANNNPELLKALHSMGVGFECVSIKEVNFVMEVCSLSDPGEVLFTPNFAPVDEYKQGFDKGIHVTIDNVYLLEKWPDVFRGKNIFLRIDTMQLGKGNHEKTMTAGRSSKFGIDLTDVFDGHLSRLLEKLEIKVIGLHAHSGSGVLDDAAVWGNNLELLAKLVASHFPQVEYIDVGGGFGLPYNATEQKSLDLEAVREKLLQAKARMLSLLSNEKYDKNNNKKEVKLIVEPGRFIVANCGVLVTKVTQLKTKTEGHLFVGLDAGMNALIRPTLYGSWHEIVNLTRLSNTACNEKESQQINLNSRSTEKDLLDGGNKVVFVEDEMIQADIVGPICETGDFLGKNRKLPKSTSPDDIILILMCGAYGQTMSSEYNMRTKAKEVLLT